MEKSLDFKTDFKKEDYESLASTQNSIHQCSCKYHVNSCEYFIIYQGNSAENHDTPFLTNWNVYVLKE